MGVGYPGSQGQRPSTLHSFGVAWSRTSLFPGSHAPRGWLLPSPQLTGEPMLCPWAPAALGALEAPAEF